MSKAAELAYERIRDAIVSGRYAAGDRLREEELSAALGVSRTPVREALRRLSAEGLIEFLPNRGAHVASWTDEQLDEIFELRALLEGRAAARAASRANAVELAQLDELVTRMEALVGSGTADASFEMSRLNNEFHQLILEASRSPRLVATARAMIQTALVHRTFLRYSDAELRRSLVQHRELVDAISAGDPSWAESVMHAHILAARHIFAPGDDKPVQGIHDPAYDADGAARS